MPAFLLLVLVVVHLSERLRSGFSVFVFSFRIVFVLFVSGLFVRMVLSCFALFRELGLSLPVWFVPLLLAAVSLIWLCVPPCSTPSFFAVGSPSVG